jgi:hypothetical protein
MNHFTDSNNTLDLYCTAENKHKKIIEYLMDQGWDRPISNDVVLYYAVNDDRKDIIDILLNDSIEKVNDSIEKVNIHSEYYDGPLLQAILRKDILNF